MQHKPDSCLVQYTDPLFAELALRLMQGCPLFGQALHLDLSKMREVTLTGQDQRTKQFTAYEQRYAHPEEAQKSACRPTSELIAQAHPETTELDLRAVLAPYGRVSAVQMLDDGARTCVVQMETAADAVAALVHAHRAPLRGGLLSLAFRAS